MDGLILTDEQKGDLIFIGELLQRNAQKEAEAIESYADLLRNLQKVRDNFFNQNADAVMVRYLDNLINSTAEKVSDELNHQKSLMYEFVEITGIQIAEE